MAEKGFIRENAVPIIVTLIVLAIGTYFLSQQGYFAKAGGMGGGSMAFKNMQLKIVLEEDGVALVGYIPPEYLMDYTSFVGDRSPGPGTMVLGFVEGGMMAEEENLSFHDVVWGFEVEEEFLGGEAKVVGILDKTGTLIDMMHIVPKGAFEEVNAQKIDVKLTAEGMPKFFYYVNSDLSNWPELAGNFSSGSLEDFKPRQMGEKTYLPVILGSDEAKMMISEKLISGTGAKIDGFFGKDAFIAGILAPTNSSLDMLHYMPA